ncbi:MULTISPECIES: hypothetical protein [unclassified Janthinobacterium]|uniref:hypothetical protein n=1 Tax=unclassified Janthinobacterium TaxID=2610881 RepID=UPI001E462FC7|nr:MULTISPECIES: hypothetical protein [unclassified Janthinobacterium]MCC7645671.1 hypothetical protein [Janthinobacterium sp. EB271-G4-3-1]MCC7692018.1 hypothetical protein [Janthinobacterium sp. EB271-G4-3-2]
MRTHDDSPRLPARPSLLTQAQQAEADRNRILTTLEGGNTGSSAGSRRGRLSLRKGMGAGAALLLLLAAGVWLGQRGERVGDDDGPAAPIALPVATAAPAIVEAPPAVASIHDEAPSGAAVPQQSLSDMLDAGAAATAAAGNASAAHPGDVLSKALETPSPPAAAAKQVARAARPAAQKTPAKNPAATPARRAEDSDIALLSALLAHAQAAPAPKKTAAGLRAQLRQCAALKRDAAVACRARACQGHDDDAQCKAGQAAAKGGK